MRGNPLHPVSARRPRQQRDAHRPDPNDARSAATRRSSASGSAGAAIMRQRSAPPTAARQTISITTNHSAVLSVPVPMPCSTATGQLAYASQWIARHDTSADVAADQAGRDDRDDELEGDRSEAEPQRPVVRAERHQRGESEVREGIDHRSDDVEQRNTRVIRARSPCTAALRKRGQPRDSKRSRASRPRMTTALSSTRLTAPAPRVVYQSS